MRNGFFLTWLRGCMRVTAGPLYGDHFQHKCIIKSTVLLSVIDVAEVLKQKEQWTRHIEGQICTQECTALSVKALQIHIAGLLRTETEMSSFWWKFRHWLHRKLSKWQLPVQPVMKISSKWRHFRFSVCLKYFDIWARTPVPISVFFLSSIVFLFMVTCFNHFFYFPEL